MTEPRNIEYEIDQTLQSLDGIKRAEPRPFFYTRLNARMEQRLITAPKRSWLLRPSVVFSALAVVILLNVVTILTATKSKAYSQTNQDPTENFAEAYGLDSYGAMFSK
ncbi:MAG: hypothetical protein U0Y10_21560 [Spirosomataceae bacterium]